MQVPPHVQLFPRKEEKTNVCQTLNSVIKFYLVLSNQRLTRAISRLDLSPLPAHTMLNIMQDRFLLWRQER